VLVSASRRNELFFRVRIERASNANHAGGKVRSGEDAETSTRDACATRNWRPLPCSISEACKHHRKKFFSWGSFLRRITLKANRKSPLESMAINFFVGREIREKQGFPLGMSKGTMHWFQI
jgi:hypothetical protein